MNIMKNNNRIYPVKTYWNRGIKTHYKNKNAKNKHWFYRTFIRLIISISIFIMVLIFKNINSKPTNFLINQINYRTNEKFELAENYNKLKSGIGFLMKESEKVLAVVNTSNISELQLAPPMEGVVVTHFDELLGEDNKISKGILIEGIKGAEIHAVHEGVVIETGYNQASGKYIVIKHKGELLSVYKNLGNILTEKDKKVFKGEVIGKNEQKLEFQIWKDSQAIDPLKYIDSEVKNM